MKKIDLRSKLSFSFLTKYLVSLKGRSTFGSMMQSLKGHFSSDFSQRKMLLGLFIYGKDLNHFSLQYHPG